MDPPMADMVQPFLTSFFWTVGDKNIFIPQKKDKNIFLSQYFL
jgi:hypothetical protein